MDRVTKTYKKINRIPTHFVPIMAMAFLSINILSLALPLTMKKIYGNVILSKSASTLRYVLMVALIALALEAIMRKVKESSSKWISAKYEYRLQTFLINKMLSSYDNEEKKDDVIANLETFKSITRITNFNSTAYYQLFIDVPFMFVFLYLIYLYGGILVYIPILLSALYVLVVTLSSQRYFKSQSSYMGNNDRLLGQLTEALEKIHFVKASGIEESQVNLYKKVLDDVTRTEFISNKYQIISRTIGGNVSQLTLFMILIGGGYLVSLGAITFGQITACAMLGGRAVSPILSLMNYYQQTMDIRILRQRIDKIAYKKDQYDAKVPDFPEDIQGSVELLDVSYSHIHSGLEETVNCRIAPGDFVSIEPWEYPSYRKIFAKIIGKEPTQEGKVLVDNLDINEWNMHSLKGKIEYLTESVNIYKGSITDNLTFFNPAKIPNAYEAAALTGLDVLVTAMPEGFATEIDSQVVNYLSAAFMQRLNLTRALLDRPRIIIFDRIDENMDDETLKMFIWLVGKLKGQSTILMASNNEQLIAMGDYHLLPKGV